MSCMLNLLFKIRQKCSKSTAFVEPFSKKNYKFDSNMGLEQSGRVLQWVNLNKIILFGFPGQDWLKHFSNEVKIFLPRLCGQYKYIFNLFFNSF